MIQIIVFIFHFIKTLKLTFVFGIIALVVMLYSKFSKFFNGAVAKGITKLMTKEMMTEGIDKGMTELDSETFMKHDEDIMSAFKELKRVNTYREDINEDVIFHMRRFFEIYFDLFYEWDDTNWLQLLDTESEILDMISSLEMERDVIRYETCYKKFEKVMIKYKLIICNKYDKDLNAPKGCERLH